MKRAAGMLLALVAASGCYSSATLPESPRYGPPGMPHAYGPQPPNLPGAVGPYGLPVTMVPPIAPDAPPSATAGMGIPGVMQASFNPGAAMPGSPPGLPPGMPAGMGLMMGPGLPPPGMPPGTPPMMPATPQNLYAKQGMVYAAGAIPPGGGQPPAFTISRTQVRFVGPATAKIGWYVPAPATDKSGKPIMIPNQLELPNTYNFLQASIYRLKLSDIPNRPGIELYPTLEVVPANPKTETFLSHGAVPVEFTEEDFDQVLAGNFITKVVYLPDAQFQSGSGGASEELVSTRLEPGMDPIAEAHRRGHILLVVRMGSINLEKAGTPPIDNPGQFGMPKPVEPKAPPMNPPPGAPAGMPGVPPRAPAAAPPAPRFTAPVQAPAGPIVPPPPGMLPEPVPTPDGVKPVGYEVPPANAYQVGPDGKLKPVALPPVKKPLFPQISLPPCSPEEPEATAKPKDAKSKEESKSKEKDAKPRKGLFDGLLK